MRVFTGPADTRWGVEVKCPSSSRVMVVFRHPGGKTGRLDRYAWFNWTGPESRSVTSRVNPQTALQRITDDALKLLFRRSLPVANTLSYAPVA
jgi:hypothetical protein